jgi:copper(I)-binding protein
MNKSFAFLALLVNLLISPLALASDVKIEDAWIREAPPVSKVQAAYLEIHNHSKKDITLTAANSPLFSRIEFHRTENNDGVMRMLREEQLTIPAGSEIQLQPDGTHMMLFNPKQSLKAGDMVPFTLTFSNQHQVEIMVVVKKAGGASHHQHHHGHH